jgi:hypothetical protein
MHRDVMECGCKNQTGWQIGLVVLERNEKLGERRVLARCFLVN